MANNSSLSTSQGDAPPNWGIVEMCNVVTAVIGGLLNTSVFISLAVSRVISVPFTIYLLNLLIANFLETACAKLVNALLVVCLPCRTHALCDLYLFSNYLAMAGMINTHLLISFNRLWAVTFPHSYRIHHSRKIAICICVAMWFYILSTVLPQLIRDSIYFRIPFSRHGRCMLNNDAQPILYFVTLMVVYIIPEVVILLTFPVIWRKRKRYKKVVQLNLSAQQVNTKEIENTGTRITALSRSPESSKSQRKSMQVLVILMVSMIICWTPVMGATVATCFVDFKNRIYFGVTTFLFALEAITDPILFGVIFSREAFRDMWHRWMKVCQ
ncbi:D(1) dopamine receptor-like [Paramacrobiotus metropolitanus]|uniref:D(1) dopamine receptor-like n=1 Tax=Paramacrobiotus metropolitanus TaxID=2943436 RepID=UPI002445AB85|nr:D(1) dopamine receptor-like [Paramacrobiotus metropolitanus]